MLILDHMHLLFLITSSGTARGNAFFGAGTGLIALDDVQCNGSELFLTNCMHTTNHNCGHSEDAGVSCDCKCSVLRYSFTRLRSNYVQCALPEICVLLEDLTAMKDVLSSAAMESMVQCVMTFGITLMQELFADN